MATLPEMNVIVNKYVVSEQPSGDAPRLMLIYHNLLSAQAAHNLMEGLSQALESDKIILLDGSVEVFQLINGKWLHLDGSIELEDASIPQKVNFREFL